MSEQRIMYVCSMCADNCSEICGYFDRRELRVLPDGKWLCDGCFDDTTQADRGNFSEDEYLDWSNLPAPPEYRAEELLMLEAALANERERCIAVCESWIGTFQKFELKHTGAREYAVDAIGDIIEVIREGIDPRAALDKDAESSRK